MRSAAGNVMARVSPQTYVMSLELPLSSNVITSCGSQCLQFHCMSIETQSQVPACDPHHLLRVLFFKQANISKNYGLYVFLSIYISYKQGHQYVCAAKFLEYLNYSSCVYFEFVN